MLGRQVAHDIVYDACRAAAESGRPLLDLLLANGDVGTHMSRSELERLLDPGNYLGSAAAMVERSLA
jgi:3-carboxy-cis,cis-muconate cycloisomerase